MVGMTIGRMLTSLQNGLPGASLTNASRALVWLRRPMMTSATKMGNEKRIVATM